MLYWLLSTTCVAPLLPRVDFKPRSQFLDFQCLLVETCSENLHSISCCCCATVDLNWAIVASCSCTVMFFKRLAQQHPVDRVVTDGGKHHS
jgi:hypothetical protein